MRNYNLNIISEEVTPLNKDLKYKVANISLNDLKLKYGQKLQFKVAGYISLFAFVFFFVFFINHLSEYYLHLLATLAIAGILLGIAYLIPDKFWVLNRLTQELTIPFSNTSKHITKYIGDVKSGWYIQSGGTTGVSVLVHCRLAMMNFTQRVILKKQGFWALTLAYYIKK